MTYILTVAELAILCAVLLGIGTAAGMMLAAMMQMASAWDQYDDLRQEDAPVCGPAPTHEEITSRRLHWAADEAAKARRAGL